MEELQKAKISRGVLANNTEKQINQLNICLKEQQAKPDVPKNNLRSLEMLIQKTKDTLTKYCYDPMRVLKYIYCHLNKSHCYLIEAHGNNVMLSSEGKGTSADMQNNGGRFKCHITTSSFPSLLSHTLN